MNKFERILERRNALIERAAQQRTELAAAYSQLQRPAAIFDKGYAFASKIKSHPGITLGAMALLGLVLARRVNVGKLAGVAVKAAKFAIPVAQFWLRRKWRPSISDK